MYHNTRYPSFRLIRERFPKMELSRRKQLFGLLSGEVSPDTFQSVHNWSRECYNLPSRRERVMCAADELLETCGVEGVDQEDGDHQRGSRYTYCNTGDSYVCTVVYDREKDRFLLWSYSDIAEAMDRNE